MGKRGPQPLPAGEGRTAWLTKVRARPDEKERYEAAAESAGLKWSEWVRAALERAAKAQEKKARK